MLRVLSLVGVLGLAACASEPVDTTPTYMKIARDIESICGRQPTDTIEHLQKYQSCENNVSGDYAAKPLTGVAGVINHIINQPAQPGCVALDCGRSTVYDAHGNEVGTAYGTTSGGVNYFGRDGAVISSP